MSRQSTQDSDSKFDSLQLLEDSQDDPVEVYRSIKVERTSDV